MWRMAGWSGLRAIYVVMRVINLLQEAKYHDLVSIIKTRFKTEIIYFWDFVYRQQK